MLDVIIVGAGVAGLTAGLYAARAGMSALILERIFPGGRSRVHISLRIIPGLQNQAAALIWQCGLKSMRRNMVR